MKVMRFAAAAMAAAAMAAAGSAQAALVTVKFTGEINYMNYGYSIDPFGIDSMGGDLATPLAYSYSLTFDTGVGTYSVVPGTDFLHSVPQNNPANRNWSLTINGITDSGSFDSGEFYNSQIGRMGGVSSGSWSLSYDGGYSPREYFAATVNVTSYAANSQTFAAPFVNSNNIGTASFHHYENPAGAFTHLYIVSGTVTGVEVLQDEEEGPNPPTPPGVPEPTTWALMIGGFGAAGAVLRRRRSAMA